MGVEIVLHPVPLGRSSPFWCERQGKGRLTRVNEKDARALCDLWLLCWTGNKPKELLAFHAIDADYRDPAVPDGLCGHDQLRPCFEKILTTNPAWVWKAIEVMPTTKGFTLKWQATVPLVGAIVESEGLDIVEVNDVGLITRNEVFFDRLPLKKAMDAAKTATKGP
jgi:hypothetical protein